MSPPDIVIAESAPKTAASMAPPFISKALPSISLAPAVNLPCNAKALIFVASNVGVDNTLVLAF